MVAALTSPSIPEAEAGGLLVEVTVYSIRNTEPMQRKNITIAA